MQLSELLMANHGKNANGCLGTNYENIPGLVVKASSTNGTSGLGIYYGKPVYWSLVHDSGVTWDKKANKLVPDPVKPYFDVSEKLIGQL